MRTFTMPQAERFQSDDVALAITARQKGSLLAPIFSNIAEERFAGGVAYSALSDPHSHPNRPPMFSSARCTVGRCLQLDETTTDGGVDKVATTTMSKEYFEDLGRIAESNAKSAQESARIATEYWVASRERSNEVAQEITRTL